MFGDIGWAELMLIGIVALIVIGPEDLPEMFRQLGRFTAKLRAMSRDFSRAMDQAAKDSGVKDVAKDLKTMTSPKAMGLDAVKSAADKFEKWDPIKNAAKPVPQPLRPPPMPATPALAQAAVSNTIAAPVVEDEALDDADIGLDEAPAPKPRSRKKAVAVAVAEPVADTPKPKRKKKADIA